MGEIGCTCAGHPHLDDCPMVTGVAVGRLTGEAELGTVELTGWQPTLHEELKDAVGKHVTLHISPGFAVTGTLEAYNEQTGVATVVDRDTNFVAAGAVAVLQRRGVR